MIFRPAKYKTGGNRKKHGEVKGQADVASVYFLRPEFSESSEAGNVNTV